MCCSFCVPFQSLGFITVHAESILVYLAKIELAIIIALLGRLPGPFQCLSVILCYTLPCQVHTAKVGLGIGVSLFRGFQEPFRRLGRILCDYHTNSVLKAK